MNVGPYEITPESIVAAALLIADSARVRALGVPRLPGETPAEIARHVLRANARRVLWAGSGHYRFMWVADFGKAYRGARHALDPGWLAGQILYMLRESARIGRVPSCFSGRRGFDMPYARADGLPWLVFCVAEAGLADEARAALGPLLAEYERAHFRDGLIAPEVRGDWMDTVRRPSSTYNNVCALALARRAVALGLDPRIDPDGLERRILERRWRGDFLADYEGSDLPSVDGAVAALYLEVLPREVREALADGLAARDVARPVPIRCALRPYDPALLPPLTRLARGYHSAIWLHLGLMYLNGLRRLGRPVAAGRAAIESVVVRYRNFVETLDPGGRLFRTWGTSTEHGFTMAAGQYLELAAGAPGAPGEAGA